MKKFDTYSFKRHAPKTLSTKGYPLLLQKFYESENPEFLSVVQLISHKQLEL